MECKIRNYADKAKPCTGDAGVFLRKLRPSEGFQVYSLTFRGVFKQFVPVFIELTFR
jgi:hypothetical protein